MRVSLFWRTFLLVAALVYWAMTMVFSYFQSRLERRMATADRSRGGV